MIYYNYYIYVYYIYMYIYIYTVYIYNMINKMSKLFMSSKNWALTLMLKIFQVRVPLKLDPQRSV